MAELDQIVSVSITADSRTPSRQGFGTPLFLTYHTVFPELYRIYTRLSEMTTDGFTTYDAAYRMAASAFAQNPTLPNVIVGRKATAPAFVTELTITSAVQGQWIRFNVLQPATGVVTAVAYQIGAAMTTTTVATAVELLTEAVTGVDSTSALAIISITPTVAGRKVFVYGLENCTVNEITADATYETDLTALELVNDDWYFVLADSSSQANVNKIAAWTLTRKKIYFVDTQSGAELDGTGTLGSTLQALGNDRTAILYAPNAHEFPAAGWVGGQAPKTPGSITWAFKNIKGTTPRTLTSTQRSSLETDNINHYQTVAGLSITRPGKVTSGEWIDIRHGIDALEARIKEDVFALLASSDKVPFTDSGFALIESAIDAACQAFVGTDEQPGLLVKGSVTIIMPALSAISTSDKQARRLTGVRFNALLAGAVHFVGITGTLTNA